MANPLSSEDAAFRFLIRALIVMALIAAVVLIVRALT